MLMRNIKAFLLTHRYLMFLLLIVLLGISLRFFDFSNRFGLAYDQARDLLVAHYALDTQILPLIGPFASAGQFVYGPQWYWILIGFVFLSPSLLLGPWILQALLYCFCIYLIIKTGEILGGRVLGIIAGILMAVSPGQIAQAVNLSSPSMVGVLSIISIFFFVRFVKKQKVWDGIFLAFFVASSINVHFQSLGLVALLIAAFILTKKSFKRSFLFFFAFAIPFIPLIFFDLTNNFFESRNVLDYYLYGQHRIYYPNRWLTYIFEFWPAAWARISGGEVLLGYLSFFGLFAALAISLYKKNVGKIFVGLSCVLLVNVLMLRYYKGPLFDSYLVFLHGIILLLTAWVVYKVWGYSKFFGIIFLVALIVGSLRGVYEDAWGSVNQTASRSEQVAAILIKEFPQEKFSVYEYQYRSPEVSLPIVLYLDSRGILSDKGIPIGVSDFALGHAASMSAHVIVDSSLGISLIDLSASSEAKLKAAGWGRVNASDVHKSTVLWYKEEKR